MFNGKLSFALLLIFLVACSNSGTKIYKVEYKGNHPEGTFRADIGNSTVFANGEDVKEVMVKMPFDFFCYSVNRESLCKFSVDVKISGDAERDFLEKFNAAKINAISRNRTVMQERISFYLDGQKTEDILTINDFANQSIEFISIPLIGKGPAEEDAKSDALKKYKKLISVLRDK